MSEVLHANIFFFITGIAVIVCSAIFCVALFHAIKVLKSMRRIMNRIEEGTEIITEDILHIREYFTQEGFMARLLASVVGLFHKTSTPARQAKPVKRKNELKIKNEA
jgi:hypothetical protein